MVPDRPSDDRQPGGERSEPDIEEDLLGAVTAAGLRFLRIDEHHAKLAGELPLLHRDPSIACW
jgi:PIN domain nuclease of toxin-antitoxin system